MGHNGLELAFCSSGESLEVADGAYGKQNRDSKSPWMDLERLV